MAVCGSRPILLPLIILSLVSAVGGLALPLAREPDGTIAPSPTEPKGSEASQAYEELKPRSSPIDPLTRLDAAERASLLRLAWQTLEGHMSGLPIRNEDLEAYEFSPKHMAKRGCFVTIQIDGRIHGLQGEFEPTRPLYQQVIVFVRRAATRDPRYSPLTEHDLARIRLRIDLISDRHVVQSPLEMVTEGRGVFLQKWGRSAVFLPALLAGLGWDAERTLDELTRQAMLPKGAWARGARIELFSTEVLEGMRAVQRGPNVWGVPEEGAASEPLPSP
jgi:AmmeMemoRadiSam system protein A